MRTCLGLAVRGRLPIRPVVSASVLSLGGLEVKEAPTVVSSSRATAQCFPIADVAVEVDVLILFFTSSLIVARASGEALSGYRSKSMGWS